VARFTTAGNRPSTTAHRQGRVSRAVPQAGL